MCIYRSYAAYFTRYLLTEPTLFDLERELIETIGTARAKLVQAGIQTLK